jgi:7,8-dihydropterin-6-yl-methyl-4-(beta-D-ribofuranosyl)aminobenzene 5'-phosphate synthase
MPQADRVEITILVDNWVDMLVPIPTAMRDCCSRYGLIEHFDQARVPPQAEFGISFVVDSYLGDKRTRILFDVGLTGSVLLHNMSVLGVPPETVDYVILSHGHPDHYGGIRDLLVAAGRRLPLSTHPEAFLPRYAVMGDGRTSAFYNRDLRQEDLGEWGADLILSRDAIDIGWGTMTTGEILRTVDFEGPPPDPGDERAPGERAPGLYQISSDGKWRVDQVWDEQALVVDVRDVGLIVLTGCGHAGVLNTIDRAASLAGNQRVYAVMGGFHLGFPTTPRENVEKTLDGLLEHGVDVIVPMHCSGLAAHAMYSERVPDRYVQPAVGTRVRFGR